MTRRIATSTAPPVVEPNGVLESSLEVWWKPYYERGTSAWSHRVLHVGDWLEVDSLQCHIVHWLTEGKGVVLKAGPGPLAEIRACTFPKVCLLW